MMKIVIGDHNYSSWSLRPWLALKQAGLPFEEICIRLRESRTRVLTYAVELPPASRAWIETMRLLPAMQEWRDAALAEMAG